MDLLRVHQRAGRPRRRIHRSTSATIDGPEALSPGRGVDGQALHVSGSGPPTADHVPVEPVAAAVDPETDRRRRPEGVVQAALMEAPEGVEGEPVDLQDPGPVGPPGPAEPVAGRTGMSREVVGQQLELLLDVEPGLEETGALFLRTGRSVTTKVKPAGPEAIEAGIDECG